jgi:hypothetical protein
MIVPARNRALVLLVVVLAGCGGTPAPPEGTGAREVVREFYEALLQRDWPRAYATLHADSRRLLSQQEFGRLAEAYQRDLGFTPEEFHIQSCDEKGTEASAHVVLIGHAATKQRRYKDAVALRHSEGWRVVLPGSFGRNRR